MTVNSQQILIIGPSTKRKGGIATVLEKYKENYDFLYFTSTFFQKTTFSFLFFPERIVSLLIYLSMHPRIMIVHIHSSSDGSFIRKYILYKIARLFNKKIVFHIHSGRFIAFYDKSNAFIKRAIEECLNNSDSLVVLSKSWKEVYLKKFKPKKINIVPNLINYPNNIIKPKNERSKIKIIFLGKIFEAKGIYHLLDTIIEHYDDFSENVSFIIAGNGEEERTRKYKLKDTKDIINFTGWVGPKEKNKILGESDILILPSFSEGLPVSILEAMSFKLPIIATPVGGIPEIVKHNINGKVIKVADNEEIYQSILFYIENKEMISIHGMKSYEMVKQHFPENVEKKLMKIYCSL